MATSQPLLAAILFPIAHEPTDLGHQLIALAARAGPFHAVRRSVRPRETVSDSAPGAAPRRASNATGS